MNNASPNVLPKCLQQLTRQEKSQIQDTLANNDVSSDEEIVEFWTTECSISKEAADEAIKFRQVMLIDPMLDLFELWA
jgi:hypothetical protein